MSNRWTSVSSAAGPKASARPWASAASRAPPRSGASADAWPLGVGARSSTMAGSIGHHQCGLLVTYRLLPVP